MKLGKNKKGLERRSHLEVILSTSPVRWQWDLQISQLGNLTRKLIITRSLLTFFFRTRKERRRRRTSCYNFSESQDHFL
ncbi:unnamed protein product [Sphagnum jensenii]|uniref:Uncharacterized protein n=1 Tax=Sphagnum jensenii TaxID=128206 RepID=A0ABP0VZD2_9BRYO